MTEDEYMQLSDTLASLVDGIEALRADVEAVTQQRYCDCDEPALPEHACPDGTAP